MDELLEQFLIEGRELVAVAHDALAALARNPADGDALDTTAFAPSTPSRARPQLLGITPAERLLHAAEEVLSGARKQQFLPAVQGRGADRRCIDQVDRWLDMIERDGGLGDDAEMPDAPPLPDWQAGRGQQPMPESPTRDAAAIRN